MMHPVGPHSAQTYWVRRMLVAVIAVAVVVGGVWWAIGRSSNPTPDNTAAVGGPTTSTKLTGVLATSPTDGLDVLTSDPLVADSTGATGTSPATDSMTGTTATSGTTATASSATGKTTTGAATTTGTAGATGTAATKPTTAATGGSATTTAPPRVTVTVTKSAAAQTTAPKTTAPQTTAPPKPSYDSAGRLICPVSGVKMTATIWGTVSGQQPRLAMNAVNTGKQPCQFNVAGAAPVYTVTTPAGAHVWSTADCFPSDAYPVTTLRPGQKISEVVVWAGKTSAPGCNAARVTVKPGKYALVIQLGVFKSAPLLFTMQ